MSEQLTPQDSNRLDTAIAVAIQSTDSTLDARIVQLETIRYQMIDGTTLDVLTNTNLETLYIAVAIRQAGLAFELWADEGSPHKGAADLTNWRTGELEALRVLSAKIAAAIEQEAPARVHTLGTIEIEDCERGDPGDLDVTAFFTCRGVDEDGEPYLDQTSADASVWKETWSAHCPICGDAIVEQDT